MTGKIEIHDRSVARRLRSLQEWPVPAEEKRAIGRFLEDLGLGKVNKGRKISESRQVKYADVLRAPLVFFGKSSLRVNASDIERFEKALGSGTFASNRGRPYSHASKVDIRRALRVYLRWRLGDERARQLTDWLDTRPVNKDPEFLSEAQAVRLYKACRSAEERFLIAVLFDLGSRATEFHNIRYEDIQLPTQERSFVRITLKTQYSKTRGRTVSLFWTHSADAVRDYLGERERAGIKSTDAVFASSYVAARCFLQRLGERVLGRRLHFLLFRHSSATYYASKLNRQQLCIRYGWAFSSRMPDVYIARSGVDMEELDKKFTGTEVEVLKGSLARMEQESKVKADRIQQLEANLAVFQEHLAKVSQVLELDPRPNEIEAAWRRRRPGNPRGDLEKPLLPAEITPEITPEISPK
jgi:integrase